MRNDIAAGRLRDGAVLPSTRQLAVERGVSVFTITEAMKTRSDEGVVRSESRSRRVVHAPDQEREAPVRSTKPHVVLVGEYEALAAAITENLQCGNSGIATAPFLREFADQAWLTRTTDESTALDATTTVVRVYEHTVIENRASSPPLPAQATALLASIGSRG